MTIKMGHNPSQIWRSIWGAQEVLNERLIWRVDNGKSIYFWSDKQLSQSNVLTKARTDTHLHGNSKVKLLINKEKGYWNRELIEDLFGVEIAYLISGIPLSSMGFEDKLIWKATINNKFSVRSAYYFRDAQATKREGRSFLQVEKYSGLKAYLGHGSA